MSSIVRRKSSSSAVEVKQEKESVRAVCVRGGQGYKVGLVELRTELPV